MREHLQSYLKAIINYNKNIERVWQLPFFVALAVGAVLFVGAYYNQVGLGLVCMIGVMAFLYIPNTPMHHRMAVVMCCSFGLSISFFLGLAAQSFSPSIPIVVAIVAFLSSALVRYYDLGAPGYFFFVLACILGTFMHFENKDLIFLVGLVSIGTMVANIMAFLYSLSVIYIFKNLTPKPIAERGHLGFDVVVVDSLVLGVFVGFAMFLGQFLELERGYWIAVSCTAIMQGISLNTIFIKQLQRILGTILGLVFAWWLISIKFSAFEFALVMMFLMFMTELVIFRNYALAMVFITPYTTYLAEATNFMNYDTNLLLQARLVDVIVGSLLGLIGGFVIHNAFFRKFFVRFANILFMRHYKH